MAEEVAAVSVAQRGGEVVEVWRDEGIRPDTTPDALAGLRPAFSPDGTVTAGNASQISDGACAVVIASDAAVGRLGIGPLAQIGSHGVSARPVPSPRTGPGPALGKG